MSMPKVKGNATEDSEEMVTKVEKVKNLVELGINQPKETFPKIKQLAESDDWKVREVAATCLVEIGRKRPQEVIAEMAEWIENSDANIRRAAVEGLREIARKEPKTILPILEKAKTDGELYVKKAVAHILREISKKNPNLVFDLCQEWAKLNNQNTNWIMKDGMRKLPTKEQERLRVLIK
jgi:3-methyladenine DNA glycosylase AlkC